jgi:hypothetical protein
VNTYRTLFTGAGVVVAAAAAIMLVRASNAGHETSPAPNSKAPAVANAAATSEVAPVDVHLKDATANGKLQIEWKSDGRKSIQVTAQNTDAAPVRILVPAGQVFAYGSAAVVLMRPASLTVPANAGANATFSVAAMFTTNFDGTNIYMPVEKPATKLARLVPFVQEHVEMSPEAIQTAVLALTENLPLSSFARFATGGSDLPSQFDTSAFKVDTCEIIAALMALREIGVPDRDLALTIDPQLKIEAMIDPMSHALAMRYYGINSENEWAYWKQHLLEGDARTRHYALFGIARFYPDVALNMLPKWVREQKANAVYRQAAIQALADTQRSEAVSILRQLQHELGSSSELGRAALQAANSLDARLQKTSMRKVAFRASGALPEL